MPATTAKRSHKPPLLVRKAVREVLLEQYHAWGHAKPKQRVSTEHLDAIMEQLETSVFRFIIGQASQGFPGRKGGARVCKGARE